MRRQAGRPRIAGQLRTPQQHYQGCRVSLHHSHHSQICPLLSQDYQLDLQNNGVHELGSNMAQRAPIEAKKSAEK